MLLNRVKANTVTTGTGAATVGTVVAPYQTWAAAGAVAGNTYSYLIEDGTAWEIGLGVYNGTTMTRPGPGVDGQFMSSTGALLNLSGTATIACVPNKSDFGGGGTVPAALGKPSLAVSGSPAVNYYLSTMLVADSDFTITKVAFETTGAQATPQYQAFVYTDNGGVPGTLLGSSAQVTGTAAGYNEVALTSPVSITKGTLVWVGLSVITAAISLWQAISGRGAYVGNGSTTVPASSPGGWTALTGNPTYAFWAVGTVVGGANGSGNNLVLLSSQTVSGASSVLFDNTKITSQYTNYVIRWRDAYGSSGAGGGMGVQLSPDNGTTWRTSGFSTTYENWGLTTNFSQYVYNNAGNNLMLLDPGIYTDSTTPSSGEATIYDLLNASTKKFMRAESIGKKSDGNIYDSKCGAYHPTAEAINAIRIQANAGTLTGTFQLFGINETPSAAASSNSNVPWFLSKAPTAASMALVSDDATNLTLVDDSDVGLTFDAGTPVSGDKGRFAERVIPTPSADWTYTVRMPVIAPTLNYGGIGINCRDSASGRYIFFAINQSGFAGLERRTNGTFSSAPVGPVGVTPKWWRIKFTASSGTLSFYFSAEGKVWTLLGTELVSSFMITNPNRVGFGVTYSRTTGPNYVGSVGYLTLA